MKEATLIIICLLSGLFVPDLKGQNISISGRLIESASKEPVEYASITLLDDDSEEIITGGLSQEDGRFNLQITPVTSQVILRVTYLGFRSIENIIDISRADSEYDLGTIVMSADEKMLDEIVVTAEQATMNLYVDRKVFNVEKDISTRGGTGEDVMRNIPGLELDAEGSVQMRNTSATIFVDGRPTVLELQEIPADQIESVEVITNPSAKFDASSAGGIINIIMKKNRKAGYNGRVSAGVGTTDRYNAMASLNIRKKPFNLSLNYNLMNAGNNINTYVDRTTFSNGEITEFFNQDNDSYTLFNMQSFRAVLDYNITENDIISLTSNISAGNWGSIQEQVFSSVSGNGMLNFFGNQAQDNIFGWRNYSTQLFYEKKFDNKGQVLTADVTYNRSNRDGLTELETNNFDRDGNLLPNNPVLQNVETVSGSNQFTAQVDYVKPLGNGSRFEAGARSFYQRSDFTNLISRFSYESEKFEFDSILTNDFDIIESINAAYVNYVGKIGSLSYQAGVRFEHSFYQGKILGQEEPFSYEYPSAEDGLLTALFPSIFLSRKINDKHEFQFNISRKIGRPRWWQLAPRVNINDPRNIRLGNPELKPEFINLTELNYSYQSNSFSIVSSVYGRITQDPITWVAFPFEGDEDVLVRMAINGELDYNFGVENIIKWSPTSQLDLTLNINTYYIRVNSNTPIGDFINAGYTYDVKPMITYRLPWDLSIQLNGAYFAPRILPQGETIPYYYADVSLNKRIGKKWTLNLILSDAFDSNIRGQVFQSMFFAQEATRRRQARFLRLTASYMFGKTDPSWMRNQRRKSGDNRGGEMDMDF